MKCNRRVIVAAVIWTLSAVLLIGPLSTLACRWIYLEKVTQETRYFVLCAGWHVDATEVYTQLRWGENAGKRHGVSRVLRFNRLLERSTFSEGELNGLVTRWDLEGHVYHQRRYEEGWLAETREFAPWLEE